MQAIDTVDTFSLHSDSQTDESHANITTETTAPDSATHSGSHRDDCLAGLKVAVLIPCYNESVTIAKVVSDFRRELPDATIYVYDNNSSDDTAVQAREAGAIVVRERHQGKGFVVGAMFSDIDADAYIMVDGDDTYPADRVRDMLAPVISGDADLVVGNRLVEYQDGAYRPMHVFGNRLVVSAINIAFRSALCDVMSGYRCFSREFVQAVPIVSRGFEVETELTLQALYRRMVIREIPVQYGKRPEGSFSKLSTVRDGIRVLIKIVDLFKAYRPLFFFGLIAAMVALVGLLLGSVPVVEYFQTGLVHRFPTAILAASLEIVALVFLSCGIVLDSINHHFREISRLVLQSARYVERRGRGK